MAIHRITAASDDFYTGGAGLNEDQLTALLPVLSNDPRGAVLYSISAAVPHALGGRTTNTPRLITILDDGITYSGFASISNGRVALDFSRSSAAIQALGTGDVLTGSFYYTARLSNGQYDLAKVTFTIRGAADTATISGTSAGSVTEDGISAAVGTLTVTDPDAGENIFQTPSINASPFGTFSFDPTTGGWRFDLNNASPNVQSLDAGDQVDFQVNVTSLDGSASQLITVTINGAEDGANITGDDYGFVAENAILTDSGTLSVTDVDTGEAGFQAPQAADLAGTYGDFTFNAATGAWTYTLRNDDANVQALIAADIVSDYLTVQSLDGTEKQITVEIQGQNDTAQILGNAISGDVYEDGTATTGGTLSVSDPDTGQNKFKPYTGPTSTTYGTFAFDEITGEWSFTIDNDAAQSLISGAPFNQGFIVYSLDESDFVTINVRIHGADDTAQILGNAISGEVFEDGTQTTGGTLSVSDPDAGQNKFKPFAGNLVQTYGTFSFDENTGEWGFTINNSAAQSLGEGEFFNHGISVDSLDGSDSVTLTVKVNGVDDEPSFGGDLFGVVHEDNNSGSSNASGTVTVSDADFGQSAFLVADPVDLEGDYGTFTFNKNTGGWTYALHNLDPIVDSLNDEGQLQDFLTISSFDGSTVQIQIDIFGHFG